MVILFLTSQNQMLFLSPFLLFFSFVFLIQNINIKVGGGSFLPTSFAFTIWSQGSISLLFLLRASPSIVECFISNMESKSHFAHHCAKITPITRASEFVWTRLVERFSCGNSQKQSHSFFCELYSPAKCSCSCQKGRPIFTPPPIYTILLNWTSIVRAGNLPSTVYIAHQWHIVYRH